MEKVEREPNRYFIGRVPLAEEGPGLFAPCRFDGERRSAWVRYDAEGSALERWIRRDAHLRRFHQGYPRRRTDSTSRAWQCAVPRVWLGLRGPVLRGHAVVLELEFRVTGDGKLKARRIDEDRRYRKHLLDTRGLGIRDLAWTATISSCSSGPPCRWRGPPSS
jgi:hypothetical protein